MASSLDQIGPITKTVHDSAMLFLGIAECDAQDATSVSHDYEQERDSILNPKLQNIRQLTVGIPKEYFTEGLDETVARGVEQAIGVIKSLKIVCKEISLPHTAYALPCYYIIMPAEVSANLARFDGMRYAREKSFQSDYDAKNHFGIDELYFTARGKGFGTEAKRRIMLGTFVLSSGYYDAYYKKAQEVRALVSRDFDEAFKDVDVILAPTTPTLPFRIGEKTNDPLQMYLSDVFTIPANLAGLPAISIPVSPAAKEHLPHGHELPIGFQLIGRHFQEKNILGIGQFYERATLQSI